jgi:putative ABC transport system permease protein
MKLKDLIFNSLFYFWRTNLAILAGVAIAVAVLSGALLVGQSVRDSLRQLLYERIGSTDFIVTSSHFFGETIAESSFAGFDACPVIFLKGVVSREDTGVQVQHVNVYGVDERFWRFHSMGSVSSPVDRTAIVGSALAQQMEVKSGDNLLLRVETPQAIPREWLYGRRDTIGRTIRLNCGEILPADRLGEFSLRPNQGTVFSIFVPLKRLQKDLAQPGRINALLLSRRDPSRGTASILNDLAARCTLSDFGLRLRDLPSGAGFSLESDRILLDAFTSRAATEAAIETGLPYSPLYTYLANSIRVNGREIPYSVLTAADLGKGALAGIPIDTKLVSHSPGKMQSEPIWLSDWAARNLKASIGDSVEIDYYLWQEAGRLVTRTATFRLTGVVPLAGYLDASFAPEIPGVTEARSISAWDPPFPLDLNRIRREDEDFWDRYRATPKAFIPFAQGQYLWQNRFGNLTALRMAIPGGTRLEDARLRFSSALLHRLDPEKSGFSIAGVRAVGLAASRGSTDFGEYFVYFSFFLIAAAILLASLFFKLMVEQRAREIGILHATGFKVRALQRIFLLEGILLSAAGSILGLLGAVAYAWLMVFGLRTWWIGAVGTRRLQLHIAWTDMLAGIAAGIFFSALAITWTLRALRKNSPRLLLSGALESPGIKATRVRALYSSALISFLLAAFLVILSFVGKMDEMEGFFGSGFLLLVSILCAIAVFLRRKNPALIRGIGWPAYLRLGMRNAMHRPGRSLICAALIASATFIIISMEAFRQDSRSISLETISGTGGYPLLAESALPIIHDPNTPAGREALGLSEVRTGGPHGIRFISFRERPGDDASCLNLYAPQEPEILGVPRAFIDAGRFSFQDSIPADETRRKNPWFLLESSPDDGVIPAIADANTVQYILHLSLGSEIVVRGDNGNQARIRFVATLRDSIFQGKLLISESAFLRLFPDHQGYRFFLLDVHPSQSAEIRKSLQELLADYGFSVESSQDRLSAYHRVENTYLSTFQSLGALGLVLGTAGLAALLLRNVLERRSELALLRAIGYSKISLASIIVFENVVLLCCGLVSGALCAILAIAPALQTRGVAFPFTMAALILLAVFVAGMISSLIAVVVAVRSPLIPALRAE